MKTLCFRSIIKKPYLDAKKNILAQLRILENSVAITLAVALGFMPSAHAIPVGGDPPPEDCGTLSANLSATPSTLDRNTSPSFRVKLTWSVDVPATCKRPLGLVFAGQSVGLSGSLDRNVLSTSTFELKAVLISPLTPIASIVIPVTSDPGIATISSGNNLSAKDISTFDKQWMQPYQKAEHLGFAEGLLHDRVDAGVWGISEWMDALHRMYELTHDEKYLAHLKEFIEIALKYRDDHHPGGKDNHGNDIPDLPALPFDSFRKQYGVPAWGGKSVNSGGLHGVNEISFGYVYPIATFARIVAENPSLHTQYGADAIRYANEALKTVRVFFPQIVTRTVGGAVEANLKSLDIHRTLPSAAQCTAAYDSELKKNPNPDNAVLKRLNQMKRNCLTQHLNAGYAMPHNFNQWFLMGIIELWKALDSTLYRNSSESDPELTSLRHELPLLASRFHRYFVNRLRTIGSGEKARFVWNYNDDLRKIWSCKPIITSPGQITCGYFTTSPATHIEDVSHGALDLRGFEVLRQNVDRLNAALPANEQVVFDISYLRRFANTFMQKVVPGTNFNENVAGKAANPEGYRNYACDGWVNFSAVNRLVYDKCQEISLRVIAGSQPYLNMGNYSALLMNKHWLPN